MDEVKKKARTRKAPKKLVSQNEEPKGITATEDTILKGFEVVQKEEELFGYLIRNLRQQGKASHDIIETWKVLKGTLNADNIEYHIAEQRLRCIAQDNRALLQQQPGTLLAGVEQAINRAKGKI